MALIALTVNDAVTYVSDRDPSKVKTKVPVDPTDPSKGTKDHVEIKEGATEFGLKPLDVFLMGHIYDNASRLSGKSGSDEVGIHTRMNQTNIDAVRCGLAWVKNFQDKKGNAVVVKTVKADFNGREYDVAEDSVLQALGIQLIQELATEIKRISEVSAEEEKNSDAASPQSGS
jgi:hypothetical protein